MNTAVSSFAELPLPMRLEGMDWPLAVRTAHRIVCSTQERHDDLRIVTLRFERGNVTLQYNVSYDVIQMKRVNEEGKTRLMNVQGGNPTAGIVIDSASRVDGIAVLLTPVPGHNMTGVTCSGESNPEGGKKGSVSGRLWVTWRPSVRRVVVHGSEGEGSPVVEGAESMVRCELQTGGPPRPYLTSVRATAGSNELGPVTEKDVEVVGNDAEGFEWVVVTWRTRFDRNDDGSAVVCRVSDWGPEGRSETRLDVLYAPWSVSFTPFPVEVIAGENISCSAKAKPPARVTIEGLGLGLQTGMGSVSIVVPNDSKPGNYSVVCRATNAFGNIEERTLVFVGKHRIPMLLDGVDGKQRVNDSYELRCRLHGSNVTIGNAWITFTGDRRLKVSWEKDVGVRTPSPGPEGLLSAWFDNDTQTLAVNLRAMPLHEGEVTCRVKSMDGSSFGRTKLALRISWSPKVLAVRVQRLSKHHGPMLEGDLLQVICETKLGRPRTETVTRVIGIKGTPRPGPILQRGVYSLRNWTLDVTAHHSLDAIEIVCVLGDSRKAQRLNIEYKPSEPQVHPLRPTPGEAVRCSVAGRPQPEVSLWLGNRAVNGSGTAALAVPKDSVGANLYVVCFARNRHGDASLRTWVVVSTSKEPVWSLVLVATAVGAAVVMVLLAIFATWRYRSFIFGSINRNPVDPLSNTSSQALTTLAQSRLQTTSNTYSNVNNVRPQQTGSSSIQVEDGGNYEEVLEETNYGQIKDEDSYEQVNYDTMINEDPDLVLQQTVRYQYIY